jgi:hypothetical protein
VGKIGYIPEELIKSKPLTIDLVLYIYKMWSRATSLFYRAYYRQKSRNRTRN